MPCLALSDTPRRRSNHSGLALSNTSSFSHHCLFSIDVCWLYGHGRQILCGHCHVTGVAVRSGDNWLKAINTDFEIK